MNTSTSTRSETTDVSRVGPAPARDIVVSPEPYPRDFVGQLVEFDLRRKTKITRERGRVQSQRWLGRTARGSIPEYELVISSQSGGTTVLARVTEDHVVPVVPR